MNKKSLFRAIKTSLLLSVLSFTSQVNAAVIIEFQEIEGNVVAYTTGTFTTPTIYAVDYYYGSVLAGGYNTLQNTYPPSAIWAGGFSLSTGLSVNPTFASGDSFGYFSQWVFAPAAYGAGGTFAPSASYTWVGQTLTSIGLGSLTEDPVLVYTRGIDGGDMIYFAKAIPEPTSSILVLVSIAFTVFAHRKRLQ
jgi:hypothetical protein